MAKSITISFQTTDSPPPFAYASTVAIEIGAEHLSVHYQREYLHREAITDKEIVEEGFTANDDIEWQGTMNKNWQEAISDLVHKTDLQEESPEYGSALHLIHDQTQGYPENLSDWEYLLEELHQAILESNGQEAPFTLQLWQSGNVTHELTAKFETRTVFLNEAPRPWKYLREVLLLLETLEIDETPLTKPKSKKLSVTMDGLNFFVLRSKESERQLLALLAIN